ncbi:hypothetical protein DFH07DRAFT_779139 [Mycena maculata]|uniref:Uncharacterized protein n=1 Tax=Mycena maculata TaxID=230809 RepID=A0AAD7MZX6_9AGAR|nr:hypothetical protein DFH07DRAFT_779139 [Mycena maculata]
MTTGRAAAALEGGGVDERAYGQHGFRGGRHGGRGVLAANCKSSSFDVASAEARAMPRMHKQTRRVQRGRVTGSMGNKGGESSGQEDPPHTPAFWSITFCTLASSDVGGEPATGSRFAEAYIDMCVVRKGRNELKKQRLRELFVRLFGHCSSQIDGEDMKFGEGKMDWEMEEGLKRPLESAQAKAMLSVTVHAECEVGEIWMRGEGGKSWRRGDESDLRWKSVNVRGEGLLIVPSAEDAIRGLDGLCVLASLTGFLVEVQRLDRKGDGACERALKWLVKSPGKRSRVESGGVERSTLPYLIRDEEAVEKWWPGFGGV